MKNIVINYFIHFVNNTWNLNAFDIFYSQKYIRNFCTTYAYDSEHSVFPLSWRHAAKVETVNKNGRQTKYGSNTTEKRQW